MKELTTIQKAQRYDELIKRLNKARENVGGYTFKSVYDEVMSELKESGNDDERMWKLIKKYAHSNISDMVLNADHITREQLESWLENESKQKPVMEGTFVNVDEVRDDFMQEVYRVLDADPTNDRANQIIDAFDYLPTITIQKPCDNVEPKFHEDEWVQIDRGHVIKILEVEEEIPCYKILNYYGSESIRKISDIDSIAHLWTIKDAKDGDVLFTSSTASHETFVFKNINERGNVECYFAYDSEDGFREGKYHFIGSATNCKPATKEQYDALMKAMSDAEYTFDFNKKELKKIEQKHLQWNISDYRTWQYIVADVLTKKDGIGQYLDDGFCKNIAKYMQEEWSKKLCLIQHTDCSEEDEDTIKFLISHFCVSHCNRSFQFTDNKLITHDELLEKIRNLRPHWKPNDNQMDALDYYANSICTYSDRQDDLRSLFNDLKKTN